MRPTSWDCVNMRDGLCKRDIPYPKNKISLIFLSQFSMIDKDIQNFLFREAFKPKNGK
jgi:hypothetical protein